MAISIEFADDAEFTARIKVVGVGGGGSNAINTMINAGLDGVEFIVANTDIQALAASISAEKIQLGQAVTRGLGAGGKPEIGRKAALEDIQRISETLQGADMVFVTAGMGGGTGTGAAPIIAQIARDQGALTVAVVTKPFAFEGHQRAKNAEMGLEELSESVDTIITLPNEKLIALADQDMSVLEAFRRADDVLLQAVRGISDLILNRGHINVDFADVKNIMCSTGRALMGTGYGRGERRAREAVEAAINSPLLDDISVEGATGILFNLTAGPDIKLSEVNEAANMVREAADPQANIIFGLVTDPQMGDNVKVTVIATGFDRQSAIAVDKLSHQGHLPLSASKQPGKVTAGVQIPRAIEAKSAQPVTRSTSAPPIPRPAPLRVAQRDVIARPLPLRRNAESPEQVSMFGTTPTRAFGHTAINDEAVLDIPAYLRRNDALRRTSE
jgi:cell division protein FtsZ